MPIAIHLAAAALSASPLVARPLLPPPPAIAVNVSMMVPLSSNLVTVMLDEASDIWRDAGITVIWRRETAEPASSSRGSATAASPAVTLHISIVDDRGDATPDGVPLGWILFDEDGVPRQEIFVSHANARFLLARAAGAFGAIDRMPLREQDTFLGRALGRALAHELGHYLLGSKAHSERGLMRGRRSSVEFFSGYREQFRVDPVQQQAIAARLMMLPPCTQTATP